MIYVTGDTHGDVDWYKLIDKLSYGYFQKGDTILIAGDFGGIWDKDTNVLDTYTDYSDVTICFVDGNHENFDLLEAYPTEEWNGGMIHRIRPNIIHLMRGEIFTIEGYKVFTFGGGTSVDKQYRLEYEQTYKQKVWWEREQPSPLEISHAMKNLEKHSNKVDYILTHTAGTRVMRDYLNFQKENTKLNILLDYVLENVDFGMWYCGHFHIDAFYKDIKTRILYKDVVPLGNYLEEDF